MYKCHNCHMQRCHLSKSGKLRKVLTKKPSLTKPILEILGVDKNLHLEAGGGEGYQEPEVSVKPP